MVYLESKDSSYRVATITTLREQVLDQPVSYGLGLEKSGGSGSWYVVAFVRPNKCDAQIEFVANRCLDICAEERDSVKSLLKAMIYMVNAAKK